VQLIADHVIAQVIVSSATVVNLHVHHRICTNVKYYALVQQRRVWLITNGKEMSQQIQSSH